MIKMTTPNGVEVSVPDGQRAKLVALGYAEAGNGPQEGKPRKASARKQAQPKGE